MLKTHTYLTYLQLSTPLHNYCILPPHSTFLGKWNRTPHYYSSVSGTDTGHRHIHMRTCFSAYPHPDS